MGNKKLYQDEHGNFYEIVKVNLAERKIVEAGQNGTDSTVENAVQNTSVQPESAQQQAIPNAPFETVYALPQIPYPYFMPFGIPDMYLRSMYAGQTTANQQIHQIPPLESVTPDYQHATRTSSQPEPMPPEEILGELLAPRKQEEK